MKRIVLPKQREVRRVVFVFDICSSSDILEGLKLNDNLGVYTNFLIGLKEFLVASSTTYDFEIYKFVGDGWILLFDTSDGVGVLNFLAQLSDFVDVKLKSKILPLLDCPPDVIGLTCGIETGFLRRVIMMGKPEYIGRPINVACRLQSSVKEELKPQYKVLVSSAAYKTLFSPLDLCGWFPKEVSRNLRNIHGGKSFKCIRMNINFLETELCDNNMK